MSSKSLMSVLNSWLSSLEVVVSSERKSELCSMVSKLVVGQCGKVEKCLVLPFSGVLNVSCCVGLRHNGGLYTQCSGSKEKGDLCVSCDRQASKNSSGEPDYGVMSSRLSVGLYDYVDSKGRKPVHYTKFMKKENLTEEAVLEEAERLGISLPREHFIVPADASKRGRPKSEKSSVKVNSGVKGRPKKEKKVVEISGDEDDLFANLVAKSVGSFVEQVVEPAAVDPVSETVSDPVVETVIETVVDPVSDPVVETVSDPVVETVAENSSVEPVAENSSVGPVAENSSVGHVVTKVTKTAAEKEKQKAEKEAQKAEKEAQKAAEKAEKEKQKAEKEAQKAAEKAEKEAQKAAEKTNKEKQKAEKVAEKVAEKAEPAEAEVVKKIEVGGVKYLKSKKTGIVYDYGEYVKTGDQIVVGQWNTDTNTIDFKMSNSDEESEEEYEE
jgi:regulator of protease activity HflC (stomatin/prohibitin superfamily)